MNWRRKSLKEGEYGNWKQERPTKKKNLRNSETYPMDLMVLMPPAFCPK